MSSISNENESMGSIGNLAAPSESSDGTNSLENNPIVIITDHSHELDDHSKDTVKEIDLNALHSEDMVTYKTDPNSNTTLSEYERGQVECFFAGLGTEIYVSSALANLYESYGDNNDWRLCFTGIPVILKDKGSTRARAIPKITLVLAERGSGFALWSDSIDNLSNFSESATTFYTMALSSNREQIMGFSFDSVEAAMELCTHIERLIGISENENTAISKRKKVNPKRVKQAPLPPKAQISQPCQFHHVTNVTKSDSDRYYSLKEFVTTIQP